MTAHDLLSAVLADPFDNGLRCALSDQVAESNVTIPALDLPQGVEVVWREWLPDEIRCTMREWCGGECDRCYGTGFLSVPARGQHGWIGAPSCPRCNSTGRTAGIAKQVCEAWPVTRVVLVDRSPNGGESGGYWLQAVDEGVYSPANPAVLTDELYDPKTMDHVSGIYNSRTEALSALSHAALNYGRRLAGLPELENK